jgi:thiol-disulfide isomerase/thioredoxin
MLLLLAGFFQSVGAQAVSPASGKPAAAELLRQVTRKYEEARFYHIESIEESEMKNDSYRTWEKTTLTAVMAPGNRYHFEAGSSFGRPLKLSDGKIETYYNPDGHEYTQEQVLEPGPLKNRGPIYQWAAQIFGATDMLKELADIRPSLLSPAYLPDEDVVISGRKISCYVIKGSMKYRGGSPDLVSDLTLWIDKEKLLVRKKQAHWEGAVIMNSTRFYTRDETFFYPVMEMDAPSVSDALFRFNPPADAHLVQEFSDPMHPKDALTGKFAPDIVLRQLSGQSVELKSLRGKPVLLDFWATWCAPCVAALDSLKELHDDTAQKGLIILSIDEDDDGMAGNNLFQKRGLNWPDFHDGDGEIWHSFKTASAVPFFVLINAEGQVVSFKIGFDDTELRTEIAKLGIDLPVTKKQVAGDAKAQQ